MHPCRRMLYSDAQCSILTGSTSQFPGAILLYLLVHILQASSGQRTFHAAVPVSSFFARQNANAFLTVQNLMHSNKGVVYKLHARWFINRTPVEFINRGPLFNLKVFSVEILQKEGKSNTKCLAARRHCDFLPQARGFRTGKDTIHQIFTLSNFLWKTMLLKCLQRQLWETVFCPVRVLGWTVLAL